MIGAFIMRSSAPRYVALLDVDVDTNATRLLAIDNKTVDLMLSSSQVGKQQFLLHKQYALQPRLLLCMQGAPQYNAVAVDGYTCTLVDANEIELVKV